MAEEMKCPLKGWQIVRRIGKGASGVVYEIHKESAFSIEKNSALKVISVPADPDELQETVDEYGHETATELFRDRVEDISQEFKIMAHLEGNSHIVTMQDYEVVQQDNGLGYDILIRMELLTPLLQYSKNRALTEEDVIRLGLHICQALEICEQADIVHRDIKPQNIFVNEYRDFKLGDFGIAKVTDRTASATKAGTYDFMAPEVFLHKPYGRKVDQYSLGLVMYWALNDRKPPFIRAQMPTGALKEEALNRRMDGEPLPPPAHGSNALKAILLKACAFDPKDRFESPRQMREALEQLEKSGNSSLSIEEPEEETENEDLTVVARKTKEGEQERPDPIPVPPAPEPIPPEPVPPKPEPDPKPLKLPWLLIAKIILPLLALAGIVLLGSGGMRLLDRLSERLTAQEATSMLSIPEDESALDATGHDSGSRLKSIHNNVIAAGATHTVALKTDGRVVAVGNNACGECDVGIWRDIISISTSSQKTVGLKANGTVVATGSNHNGDCNVSDWNNIVAISAGLAHTVGVKSDGTAVAVGCNDNGQCDVADWSDIVEISAGISFTIGLKSDGTVVATGSNILGQCNVTDWHDIVAVSAPSNASYTLGLKEDGTVVATGDIEGLKEVFNWHDIVAIEAKSAHIIGLKADGTVVLAVDRDSILEEWELDVAAWHDIVAVSTGFYHVVGLRSDGTVVADGRDDQDQCDVSSWRDIRIPNARTYIDKFAVTGTAWQQDGTELTDEQLALLVPGSVVEINYSSTSGQIWLVIPWCETGWQRIQMQTADCDGAVCRIPFEEIAAVCGNDVSAWGRMMQCESDGDWEVYSVCIVSPN